MLEEDSPEKELYDKHTNAINSLSQPLSICILAITGVTFNLILWPEQHINALSSFLRMFILNTMTLKQNTFLKRKKLLVQLPQSISTLVV